MDSYKEIIETASIILPFIKKIGEGTANKIGEGIWNLIKRPFDEKGGDVQKLNDEEIEKTLIEILKDNPQIKNKIEELIQSNSTQEINNNGKIKKQVNIGNITNGNFNF